MLSEPRPGPRKINRGDYETHCNSYFFLTQAASSDELCLVALLCKQLKFFSFKFDENKWDRSQFEFEMHSDASS